MEDPMNISSENAKKLYEEIKIGINNNQHFENTSNDVIDSLSEYTHISIMEKRVQYQLNFLKASILTRWYWRRKRDKINLKYEEFMRTVKNK
ncbi:hypothetical protein NBY09_01615 [Elizabethkingia anophelis]|uniref:hypothetical protein n=1 Tax=Elizabethkingia anophelis TaxID=1117645 RepID=UPI002350807A|nr:hypothetical protein [Elizabethkingia anophelis]MDC8024880.1 hypothetical protein [Elizabethkingia anophelis]